ncbi:MAG: hypothetical protein K2H46_10370 [Muribaculaceae bacterium]|nr:hypothetical protein [Muribaculaceae bacterium]
MGSISDFLFNNKKYKEVNSSFNEVHSSLKSAFSIWCQHFRYSLSDDYESKEFIYNHISEIRQLNKWIEITNRLISSKREAITYLYIDRRGKSSIPFLSYEEYKFIALNEKEINLWSSYIYKFNRVKVKYRDAIKKLLNHTSSSYSHIDIRRIANLSDNVLIETDSILRYAKSYQTRFPKAWTLFSKGQEIDNIPLDEMRDFYNQIASFRERMNVKEIFLDLWNKQKTKVMLLMNTPSPNLSSFEIDEIEKEKLVIELLEMDNLSEEEIAVQYTVHLDDKEEFKRIILDSSDYEHDLIGLKYDSPSSLYRLREDLDKQGVKFDYILELVIRNEKGINEYKKSKGLSGSIYISDYSELASSDSSLSKFIKSYEKEREYRDEVVRLQRQYREAFENVIGDIDVHSIPLSEILQIIEQKDDIYNEDRIIRERERIRKEEIRKQKEEEKFKIEFRRLVSCILSWKRPSWSVVPCFSLYYYYPTTCTWDASQEEWDIRNLIWDFKVNPNKPQSESEINKRQERAHNKLLPEIEKVINHFFGSAKSSLTLVCIPSSKKSVSERRYRDFAEKLCIATGMENGYNYIEVLSDGEAKHLGGDMQSCFSIDDNFFKNKFVLLFDDVITSGRSMERLRNLLIDNGAKVIGGLSIGKTKHERQGSNPIDSI